MSERDVYHEPETRVLLRTTDAYQTESTDEIEGYSETLLGIVADYCNGGRPEGTNAQAMVGKSKRGEVAFRLFAAVNSETLTVERAGFKTRGCLAMTACASVLCNMIEGKTFAEILQITPEDIRVAVDGVPVGKANTLVFAVEAARALIGDFLVRQGASLADLDDVVPCDYASIACLMCEHCSLRETRIDLMVADMEA